MGKASQAIDSARLLFEAGDIDGATNRAYYAMFDAANPSKPTAALSQLLAYILSKPIDCRPAWAKP